MFKEQTHIISKSLIEYLGGKYKFDIEEELKLLSIEEVEEEINIKKQPVSSKKKVKIPLPWMGVIDIKKCKAIKFNHGLHTQCTKDAEDLCAKCQAGKLPYGRIEERKKVGVVDYIDPKGKKTIPYINVLEKLNIDLGVAKQTVLEVFGTEIPEEHLVRRKTKRGRPKKVSTSVSDTESESSEPSSKKRGRPKKKKEMISTLGNDLIESLISSNASQASRDNEIMTAVFGEDSASEEETDEPPNPPGDDNVSAVADEIAEIDISESRDDNEVDGNIEQEDVVEFEWDGKKYFKDQDNDLFDPTTGEHIGQYDAEEAIVELYAS